MGRHWNVYTSHQTHWTTREIYVVWLWICNPRRFVSIQSDRRISMSWNTSIPCQVFWPQESILKTSRQVDKTNTNYWLVVTSDHQSSQTLTKFSCRPRQTDCLECWNVNSIHQCCYEFNLNQRSPQTRPGLGLYTNIKRGKLFTTGRAKLVRRYLESGTPGDGPGTFYFYCG